MGNGSWKIGWRFLRYIYEQNEERIPHKNAAKSSQNRCRPGVPPKIDDVGA